MTADNRRPLRAEQRRGIYITIAFALIFIVGMLGMFIHGLTRHRVLSDSQLRAKGIYVFDKPHSIKPFKLVDYNKQPFTPADFLGKWTLAYFGYTYCPDLCPTTMALLNRFYQHQQKGNYGHKLHILMVSVDPGRDTPKKLYDYVRYFNKDFQGVTGEFLELHRLASELNIAFNKIPGSGKNYQVQHSGNVAIINPKGQYIGFFRPPLSLSQLNTGYETIRETRGG